jgi:hypothetical protein
MLEADIAETGLEADIAETGLEADIAETGLEADIAETVLLSLLLKLVKSLAFAEIFLADRGWSTLLPFCVFLAQTLQTLS